MTRVPKCGSVLLTAGQLVSTVCRRSRNRFYQSLASTPSCSHSTIPTEQRVRLLRDAHRAAKDKASKVVISGRPVDEKAVFANNELDLKGIQVFGFDYDYTLAVYTKQLNNLIYEMALHRLVNNYRYPTELLDIPYDPLFAVRGLHFDIANCILMKLDAFAQIQSGTVYRGKYALSDDQVREMYHGLRVPIHFLYASPSQREPKLKQLLDLFSLPEVGLLTTAAQYFQLNELEFDAFSLFSDVQAAVAAVHVTGELYAAVKENLPLYVHKNPGLIEFFERLHQHGKTTFLVTNSPYSFMDSGMQYLIGPQWRELFDFVVVQAHKPRFFQDNSIPFRQYIISGERQSYQRVRELKRGAVYTGGNIHHLEEMAGFKSKGVLYFGDHIFSDLADPMLQLGWNTGAIVPELEREIKTQNTVSYQTALVWLKALTKLIERHQDQAFTNDDTKAVIYEWLQERDEIRRTMKAMFNPQFGSLFRTFHNPSYFSRRLARLADIYTSRLPNLNRYGFNYAFYPKRSPLPHEQQNNNSNTEAVPAQAAASTRSS